MGLPVLVLGESGTGKSASMRNFKKGEIAVINVAGKPLPFKTKLDSVTTDTYSEIKQHLKNLTKNKVTKIVIDDAQYLMANEFMRRATERGFDKFTEIAQNFWSLVNAVKELPNDVIVYFMAHIERDANGNEKIKTIGKLLDEKITVEGMFTIVLKTNVNDGQYSFVTQNNGHDTVKSPIGMFPAYLIDNDLKYVDEKIRNYYEMGEFLSDEELAAIDETVKHGDMPFEEEKKGRKSRRGKEKEKPKDAPQEEEEKAAEPEAANTDGAEAGQSESDSGQTRRRRSAKAELEAEREEVRKENGKAIAEANTTEDGEGIPFEEAEEPELKEMPKRKRRGAKTEEAMTPPIEIAPAEEAPRRRRRRA